MLVFVWDNYSAPLWNQSSKLHADQTHEYSRSCYSSILTAVQYYVKTVLLRCYPVYRIGGILQTDWRFWGNKIVACWQIFRVDRSRSRDLIRPVDSATTARESEHSVAMYSKQCVHDAHFSLIFYKSTKEATRKEETTSAMLLFLVFRKWSRSPVLFAPWSECTPIHVAYIQEQ